MADAFTGHRPDRLGGYGPAAENARLRMARYALYHLGVERAIVGMALGWDMAVAMACAEAGIPFDAYVPFDGHGGNWPASSRAKYRDLLDAASSVRVVTAGGFSNAAMQARNEAMVVDAGASGGALISLCSGEPSGTARCVEYAHRIGVEVIELWPFWVAGKYNQEKWDGTTGSVHYRGR